MLTLSLKSLPAGKPPLVAIAERARLMQASGLDVSFLTSGEPDFSTPRHVKEAAIIAIEQNLTKYSPSEGLPDLVQAIIRKFSRENDLHFELDQVLVCSGAKQCISNALQAICNKGDEVIIISPHCPDYPEMISLAEAIPVMVKARVDNGFNPDARDIRKAVNQRTKALILNTPNNPTGAVYSQSQLEEISSIAKDAGIYVIADEIYETFVYDDARTFSVGSLKKIKDQVITVNSASMTYSMTGWRVGYMGGPRAVIERATRLQSLLTSGPNSVGQKAVLAAINGSASPVSDMVEEFKRRRNFTCDFLSGIRGVKVRPPRGGFFLLLGVEECFGSKAWNNVIKNSSELASHLLEHHHVVTSPGSAFGDDKYLRISYAYSMSDLERGLNRLKLGLESFR